MQYPANHRGCGDACGRNFSQFDDCGDPEIVFGHARKNQNAIWSLGQAMFTQLIVVVDHDVDVHNYSEVVWALSAVDPERDLVSLGPVDTLIRRTDSGLRLEDGVDATQMADGFYAAVAGRNPDDTNARVAEPGRLWEFDTQEMVENQAMPSTPGVRTIGDSILPPRMSRISIVLLRAGNVGAFAGASTAIRSPVDRIPAVTF